MSLSNKLTLDKVDVKGKRVVMRWALIIAWQLASAGNVAANRKWDYWWASPKCRVCSSCGGRLFGAHTQWCEGIKVMAKWCLSRFSPTGRRQEVNSSVVTFSFHVTCLCGGAAWMYGTTGIRVSPVKYTSIPLIIMSLSVKNLKIDDEC